MSDTPLLEIRDLTKTFGSVQALTDVDFEVRSGEVMALVGDNGAGKSTLIKCIAGIYGYDSGEIFFDGEPVTIHGPKDAAKLGIEVVYQDLALCDNLDVVQNMYLGREIRDFLFRLKEPAMEQRTSETLKGLRVTTIQSIRQAVASLSGGQRQSVAVARAVMWNSSSSSSTSRPRRSASRRPSRCWTRQPAGRPGPCGRPHLAQPARHLRDRDADHRPPPRPQRRHLRARQDDAAGGRARDHRRNPDEGRRSRRDRTPEIVS